MELNSLVGALRHCGRIQCLRHGKSFHCHFTKLGLSTDVFYANNVISMYVESNSLGDACRLFDEMSFRNIVTWSTMISACTSAREPVIAIKMYNQMLDSEAEVPNGFVYSAVLKACGLAGDMELGKSIHKSIRGDELGSDTVLMNTLLDMYAKCGSMCDARRVFDDIKEKTSVSWNTIISGYCKEGLMEQALSLFHQMPKRNVISWNSIIAGFADKGSPRALECVSLMHRQGYKLDGFTFPCALKTCGSLGFIALGRQVHGYVAKSGFSSSCFSASALVDMYSDCAKLDDAIKVFGEFLSHGVSIHESLVLYNSILSGYVSGGRDEAALKMLSEIHTSGVHMDSYTFSSGLKASINLMNLKLGLQVHGLVTTSGYELDYVIGSILIDLYAKHGNLEDALGLFYCLPRKDIVAWSGLIMGCAKMGLYSLSFSLFKDMISLGEYVDEFIISSILKVCSSLASIRSGKQVHAFCAKSGYLSDGVVVTSLIDMYTKCGEIDDGLGLFNSLLVRDTVCWTGIIVGCGQNGKAHEALRLFHEMMGTGLEPNEVTFLGVLAACRHSGLVEQARTVFNSMEREYGVKPQFEHYYCMVELLGQAGHLNEAEELIFAMPMKPDKTIWGSLLAAAGNHKNAELVNRVGQRLLVLLPKDPSVYVMISNVYATLEMWDSLSKVREHAKKAGAKEAGKSWVEMA
ncbi:pentatricopeptide repeat-containing protein At4g08210 isoform X1 [Punica granatum]|uniref:Pentatricopeptide repeat-containing protein At4g08210 isoform X1 n=1 Tax=Punica granatum TaxID=22663 RepID=A0A6P8DAP3_PUNGR|nr:pentatricopeptide repeat-containing protein At4g08210 isoform X1 [Punica granatum]